MEKHPSFAEMKDMVGDCFRPNPWIYWADYLGCVIAGYAAFYLLVTTHSHLLQALYYIITVCTVYRAALFIHELTHQERSDLPFFSIAWNIFTGLPLMIPSFFYRGVHIDHHKRSTYSTFEDGEYMPMGATPFYKTLGYILSSFILPFTLIVRFALIAPLSLIHPKVRLFTMRYLSAFAIRFDTPRRIPEAFELRRWYVQEAMTFVFVWTMILLFAKGILPVRVLPYAYVCFTSTFIINSLRTVLAHRYRNLEGSVMSFQDQLLDSVNIGGNAIWAELFAPVGLRFHGLHHMFPSMPYHALYRAHRIYCERLPKDSFYFKMLEPSIASAALTHWHNTHHLPTAAAVTTTQHS